MCVCVCVCVHVRAGMRACVCMVRTYTLEWVQAFLYAFTTLTQLPTSNPAHMKENSYTKESLTKERFYDSFFSPL